jgi:hypothetical protein
VIDLVIYTLDAFFIPPLRICYEQNSVAFHKVTKETVQNKASENGALKQQLRRLDPSFHTDCDHTNLEIT